MGNGHLPLGYCIENGRAVEDEEKAGQVRQVYAGYLSGLSYMEAAKAAGLSMSHTSVKRMLQNGHYLGDDYYPALIDRETYDAAEKERQRRSKALGRDNLPKKELKPRRVPVAADEYSSNLCPSAEKNRTELFLGDMPMSTTKAEMLRTMRMKCLDCTCNQVKEVQLYPAEDCPLWPFRMGKDPNKKARQMSEAQKAALDAARRKAANSRTAKNI